MKVQRGGMKSSLAVRKEFRDRFLKGVQKQKMWGGRGFHLEAYVLGR